MLAAKCRTKGGFCCAVMKMLFTNAELKGMSTYGSKGPALDHQSVERIRCYMVLYGDSELSEKE